MVLIAEDGTGRVDAESFATLAELKDYATRRGLLSILDLDDDSLAQHLRTATEYVDTFRRYKGRKAGPDQALQFPRVNLEDWSGYTVTGVPRKVKEATCFLASQVAAGEPLYEVLDQAVASESVGPISTSYVQGATRHREFTVVDKALAEYIRGETSIRPRPGWSQAPSPNAFALGGMNNPPDGEDRYGR